jgi:hypothetical protein
MVWCIVLTKKKKWGGSDCLPLTAFALTGLRKHWISFPSFLLVKSMQYKKSVIKMERKTIYIGLYKSRLNLIDIDIIQFKWINIFLNSYII